MMDGMRFTKFCGCREPFRSAIRIHGLLNRRAEKVSASPCVASLGAALLLLVVTFTLPCFCAAQVSYVARFSLEREKFLLGEPVFCDFTIKNTGARTIQFTYRSPSRVLNRELEQEPRFRVRDESGRALPDPAPQPCGGAKGSAVYGTVTLPAGQTHTERWLLNQWARFPAPGRFRVRAERRLPLLAVDPATGMPSARPVAYALALNEFSFELEPAAQSQLESAFQPYVKLLDDPKTSNKDEAFLVVTTLPQPFLLPKLEGIVNAPAAMQGLDRRQVLEGLARLGTPAAWEAILKVARGEQRGSPPRSSDSWADVSLRAYALLLLGEKGDAAFLPPLLEMVSTAPAELRGDVLRSLGFFRNPHANQVLLEKLHSPDANDRVNALLGLKNLESRDAIPALLAMLNDANAQVRQVANFALQSLTGQKFKLSAKAPRGESVRVAERWHAWWREQGASFVPLRQPACHDW